MRCAIVETATGTVVNIALFDQLPAGAPPGYGDGHIAVAGDGADMGWHWDGAAFSDPNPPAADHAAPQTITDVQFFLALRGRAMITDAEARAAIKTGDVPAALMDLVVQLPAEQQFTAEMFIAGNTTFDRVHPITLALAAAKGWSADDLAALWREGAAF